VQQREDLKGFVQGAEATGNATKACDWRVMATLRVKKYFIETRLFSMSM